MAATETFTRQEAVRLVGLRMLADGSTAGEVAEALHVGESTARSWRRRLRDFDGDVDAAAHDAPRSGAPCKLSVAQRAELVEALEAGAEAAGFEGQVWTLPRVRQWIRDRFGVEYHVDHLGRLLRSLGLSPQQPSRRAAERDEAAIERFRTEVWPEVVKKGGRGSCHTSCR
jgi:transposase